MKISTNKKMNITVVAILVLVVALWGLAVWLVNKEASTLHQTVKEVSQLDTKRENLVAVKKSVESVSAEAGKISSYFISSDEVILLIEKLERLENRLGVLLEVQEIEDEGGLSLSFRITGAENKVIEFIELAENLPFALSFNSVNIKELEPATEESGAKWIGDVDLIVLSYIPKDEN